MKTEYKLRLRLAWWWFRNNLKNNTHWYIPRLWPKDLIWAVKTQYYILIAWKRPDPLPDGQFYKKFSPWLNWEVWEPKAKQFNRKTK